MQTFKDIVNEQLITEKSAEDNVESVIDLLIRAKQMTRKGGVIEKQAVGIVGKGIAKDLAAVHKMIDDADGALEDVLSEIQQANQA